MSNKNNKNNKNNTRDQLVCNNAYWQAERGELLRKYYDLYFSKIEITSDEITDQQKDQLADLLFNKGKACITRDVLGRPLISDFTENTYNNEGYPVSITLIPPANSIASMALYPKSLLKINMKDCVIIYIRPSKHSIYEFVEFACTKIADISLTIRINTFVQRLPLLFGVDPEDEAAFKSLIEDIENGKIHITTGLKNLNSIQTIPAPSFNIDKLRAEKEAIENELKTQLGINNNDNIKKERMIVDEVTANNDEIEAAANIYITPLQRGCKAVKDTLGITMSIDWNAPVLYEEVENEESKEEEKDEEL